MLFSPSVTLLVIHSKVVIILLFILCSPLVDLTFSGSVVVGVLLSVAPMSVGVFVRSSSCYALHYVNSNFPVILMRNE